MIITMKLFFWEAAFLRFFEVSSKIKEVHAQITPGSNTNKKVLTYNGSDVIISVVRKQSKEKILEEMFPVLDKTLKKV